LAPDFLLHPAGGREPIDREQFLRVQDARTTAFPDVSHTFEEQIAEGDLVATRMTQRGTHSGDYMGHPGDREAHEHHRDCDPSRRRPEGG
jgi:hypothetical protein